jgi:site-specific DNA recombinase
MFMSKSSLPHTALPRQSPGKYAAAYVRVSTEDQGKGYSIPTQIEACLGLAQQEGYTVQESHIFIDEGISGTTLDRPALRRLRDIIRDGALAAVCVIDPDRLARKTGKLLVLKDELDEHGVRLLCVSHGIDDGAEGSLFFQIRGAVAEYEREKLLERTRRGTIGRIKAGYPHSSAPLGYRYIPEPHKGRYEVDEEEAALVRRISALYGGGISMRAIARQLIDEGVATPSARRQSKKAAPAWNTATLAYILANEAYTGNLHWNKRKKTGTTSTPNPRQEWYAVPIPPLIAQCLFDAVRERASSNKALSRRNRKHEYLFLHGRLRCGRCGQAMGGYSTRGKRWYRCKSQLWHPGTVEFCRGGVLADEVEAPAWQAVYEALCNPESIMQEVARQRRAARDVTQDTQRESAALAKALAGLDREARQWERAYATEDITLEEFRAYRLEIRQRRERLEAQVRELKAMLLHIKDQQETLSMLEHYCAMVREQLTSFDMSQKQRVLESLYIVVAWSPGEALAIKGSIKPGDIAPNTPRGV